MGMLTSFTAKKLEKQLTYERNVLRDLCYRELCRRVHTYWQRYMIISHVIENICIDAAVEAYLLGAHYSRFAYYGEKIETVKSRCIDEYEQLIHELHGYMKQWRDGIYDVCARYIDVWWEEGMEKGLRRQKLRLK